MRRRDLLAGVCAGVAWPLVAWAQADRPDIVFGPKLDAPSRFRVRYRLRQFPSGAAAADGRIVLDLRYRLTVTAIAREPPGYRLRLLIDSVERPSGPQAGSMDMVVAAALMLDGLPVEMLADARGFPKQVADWPRLQAALDARANALPGGPEIASIGHSVVDDRTAAQVADYLAPALEAMSYARSTFDVATRSGASIASWFGTPVAVKISPRAANGSVGMTWAIPAGQVSPDSEGQATFRPDGFVARLQAIRRSGGVSREEQATEIEEVGED